MGWMLLVIGFTLPLFAWHTTGEETLALPSILIERNRSKEWAGQFWVVEEKQSLPLVFDITRTGHRRCGAGFGNIAMTRVPPSVEEDAWLVLIRTKSSRRQRYGRRASIGVLRATNLIQLLQQQPMLEFAFPDRPLHTPAIKSSVLELTNMSSTSVYLPTWWKYEQLLQLAENTHQVYRGLQDKDIWRKTLCCLNGLGDGRLFYLNTSRGTGAYLVTAAARNLGLHIYAIEGLQGNTNNQPIKQGNQRFCPKMSLVKTLHTKRLSRNNVPLVQVDGLAWPGNSSQKVWFLDPRGGQEQQPLIFSIIVLEERSNRAKMQQSWTLQDCQYLKGWRGNSPLLQFSEFLWIAVVHKYIPSKSSERNQLGRTYFNKVVLFEADSANSLPRRCIRSGPEASGRDIFQRQPFIDSDWPFAFILGLVYLGMKRTYLEGEEHEFLVSAGIDDSEPAMKVFSVFVPKYTAQNK